MSLNHRGRLALISAAAAGTILALLFSAIVFFSRRDVLTDKRAELGAVMRSFTAPNDARFDLPEFHGAHPELAASVFEKDGTRVGSEGRRPPDRIQGYRVHENRLELGTRFGGQDVTIALDLRDAERGLDRLTVALIALWLPLTLLVGGVTWAAAQSVFRPLERLSAQALAMSGTNLAERLDTLDRAEFGAFAQSLNQMLDRIEETVRRGERFSMDAAHELRTPLAILRTRLETALIQPRLPEQYVATIGRSIEEIDRLTGITESLLRTARGSLDVASSIDLQLLVVEAEARWNDRFTARDVRLQTIAAPARAAILPDELRIVIDNLLDNALRYAPPGSQVSLTLEEEDGATALAVHDEGPGVSPELGERIFDRFVRADEGRNRASGGAGIGLSVCRQIVEGRGGSMTLVERPPRGVSIGCRLPASAR